MPKRSAPKPAQSPSPVSAGSSSPPLSESGRLLQSALGPDYELGELLGKGGFAEVYVAWDRRLKREVAVKTIRGELAATAGVLERFRREAEAIAKLRHPHIVPVYSVGEANGIAYFTMPRIRGESLAAALEREERWSFAEVVRVLREAASALAEAHRNGIVHRDVKPENIMLDGPERRVVVMDFGIAKMADETMGAGLTGTGILVGTPFYMSPEQAAGDRNIDHLSDQYSLGLVGYRLLTGKLPFDAESVRAVLFQQAAVTVTPVRELRPDIPVALSKVIERALQKDPAQRYRSMDELAAALSRMAGAVAGEFRTGRRAPSMPDRWANVRLEVGGRELRYMATAVAALVAFVFAFTAAEFGPLRQFLGRKDEAYYAAKAFLVAKGAREDITFQPTVAIDRTAFDFVQSAVSPDSVRALIRSGLPVFRWSHYANWASMRESWVAEYGPSLRLNYWWRWISDSIKVGAVSADSAHRLVENELRARGLDPSTLSLLRRSESQLAGRTDRGFTFELSSARMMRGVDTLRTEIDVRVAGDQVVRFDRRLVATSLREPAIPFQIRRLLSRSATVVMLLIAVLAGVLVARRAENDTLQWASALRWGAVPPILLMFGTTLPRILSSIGNDDVLSRGLTTGLNTLTNDVAQFAMIFLIGTVGFVAVESFANEKRPDLTFGATEWARGRFAVPEAIPAALAGYSWCLGALAAGYAVLAVARQWLGAPYEPYPFQVFSFNSAAPMLSGLYALGGSLGLALAPALFIALALHRGIRPWAPVIVFAVLAGAFRLSDSGATELRIAVEVLAFLGLSWIVHRHGLHAAVVAAVVASTAPVAIDFFWAGGPFVSAGVATMLMGLAPAAIAVRAWQLRPR